MEEFEEVKTYWGNGNLREKYHKNSNNLVVGVYELYYSNGVLEERYVTNSVGELDGLWETYYDDALPYEVKHFVNSVRDGFFSVTNEDGTIFEKGYYKDGLKVGLWEGNRERGFKYYL